MNTRSDNGSTTPKIGLVLGGGALKGLAHIGALRALEEAGIVPALYAGTSIGAMLAAAAASGMTAAQMSERALQFKRKDLFRINHVGMVLERMHSQSIYLEGPLRDLCDELVAEGTFDDLRVPLLVTAVDVDNGIPVVFGLPGLRDVRVRDAVYASCALPGFFPPGVVGNRSCIDGGTTDNLPVNIAGPNMDAVIAIDVGIAEMPVSADVATQGFATVFMRAATMMMHNQQQFALEHWNGPPMLLVRPRVSHISWFSFSHTEELLKIGYESMKDALHDLDTTLAAQSGIYPRRAVHVVVDRVACTGCGLCVARRPDIMTLDEFNKAVPLKPKCNFSPADGAFVRSCPWNAIKAMPVIADEETIRAATGEFAAVNS